MSIFELVFFFLHYLFKLVLFFFLNTYPGVELLGHMVVTILIF